MQLASNSKKIVSLCQADFLTFINVSKTLLFIFVLSGSIADELFIF
jgi:hypothetical protein